MGVIFNRDARNLKLAQDTLDRIHLKVKNLRCLQDPTFFKEISRNEVGLSKDSSISIFESRNDLCVIS